MKYGTSFLTWKWTLVQLRKDHKGVKRGKAFLTFKIKCWKGVLKLRFYLLYHCMTSNHGPFPYSFCLFSDHPKVADQSILVLARKGEGVGADDSGSEVRVTSGGLQQRTKAQLRLSTHAHTSENITFLRAADVISNKLLFKFYLKAAWARTNQRWRHRRIPYVRRSYPNPPSSFVEDNNDSHRQQTKTNTAPYDVRHLLTVQWTTVF